MTRLNRSILYTLLLSVLSLPSIALAQTRLIEESDPSITYTGSWVDVDDARLSGGSGLIAREAGARASVSFNGTGIAWMGFRCDCAAGIARVRLDGQLMTTLNTNDTGVPPNTAMYRTIWSISQLSSGQHTLEIEVTGESAGSAAWVVIDSFRISGASGGADSVAPAVSITAPEYGAPVGGVVTLSATASDNVGVSRVRFLTSNEILIGEDNTAPYSITRDISGIPSGRAYTLHAEAVDTSGNVGQSALVSVHVNQQDQSRPLITITAPADGATISGVARFAANASDDQGVAYVNFLTTGSNSPASFASAFTAPYEVFVDTRRAADGAYPLYAQATDVNENTSTMAGPITVTVDNRFTTERTRVDDADPAAVYTGTWTTVSDEGRRSGRVYHWNSAHISDTPGATVRFTFTGTGVRWLGTPCYECGAADVSIDGGAPTTIVVDGIQELGGPRQTVSQVLYASPVLPHDTHTIDITVRRYEYSFGGGMNILVDAFEVLP